ncbi:MAG: alpha/beta hydrolase [Chloroflexota bacterium]|nr:alpha/beta hydrolase [Chloroflexota bacterium]
MIRQMVVCLLLVPVVLLGLGASSVSGAAVQTPVASLEWTPCPSESAATPSTGDTAPLLECATLSVPLDYANPDGEQITIGLNRLVTTDLEQRIGSLIFNPGGPGGIASDMVAAQASGVPVFTDALRARFDIIGMDPRGVGSSAPVQCDPDVWNEPAPVMPRSRAEFDQALAHAQAVGESCLELTGPLLGHLDTVSAARDIEQVRIALGGEPLNYLGLSYGTQLGATYASLYPDQIRAMALDGALDHNTAGLQMLNNEAAAHEATLRQFALWCDANPDCALHGEDVLAVYDELVAQGNASPLPAPRCEASGTCRATVTGDQLRFSAQGHLLFEPPTPAYGHPGWAGLAEALAAARDGDASGFSLPLAQSTTANLYPQLLISCVEWPTPFSSYDELAAATNMVNVVSPHVGGATQTWTTSVGCMDWPVPIANPPTRLDVTGTPPILIVNATHDPSTSYVWAQLLHEQIDNSVLLTRNGNGHTSYLLPGESQTRDAIDAYLLDLELPAPNTILDN